MSHTCARARAQTRPPARPPVLQLTRPPPFAHTHVPVRIRLHTSMQAPAYTHTRTHTHTHTHTHASKRIGAHIQQQATDIATHFATVLHPQWPPTATLSCPARPLHTCPVPGHP
eukprot:15466236-Alexandrium_andersonii.AAC.1